MWTGHIKLKVNLIFRLKVSSFFHSDISFLSKPILKFIFHSGYAFLLFQDEISVQSLIEACIQEDDKLYLCVSSPTIKDKPVSVLVPEEEHINS